MGIRFIFFLFCLPRKLEQMKHQIVWGNNQIEIIIKLADLYFPFDWSKSMCVHSAKENGLFALAGKLYLMEKQSLKSIC